MLHQENVSTAYHLSSEVLGLIATLGFKVPLEFSTGA